MKNTVTEWSRERTKRIRTTLFVVRCILIVILPMVGSSFFGWHEWVSEKSLWVALAWSTVYMLYLCMELFVRVKTRAILKEPVFMKLLIFFAVISPLYFICFVFVPVHQQQFRIDPMIQRQVDPIKEGLRTFAVYLRYFTWPDTAFLLYETVLAIVISKLNKKTFPKNKAKQDGSSAE